MYTAMMLLVLQLLLIVLCRQTRGLQPAKTPCTLLTFDVDGTLVVGSTEAAANSAHARAFGYAVGKVFGGVDNYHIKVPSPPALIPPECYHGSTDGIIALNMAYYGFQIEPKNAHPKLKQVFEEMYEYVKVLEDTEMAEGIDVLPGVLDRFNELASEKYRQDNLMCGLVTGNVEGIARKKMRAVGISDTKALSPKSIDQTFQGEDQDAFLGGFGSCYCYGDIKDRSRIYKDRGEQIMICIERAKSCLKEHQQLVRVVHVGDAPADVLAAKYTAATLGSRKNSDSNLEIGMIAVATGKFSARELQNVIDEPIDIGIRTDWKWDPLVLERGMGDDRFIEYCKIKY